MAKRKICLVGLNLTSRIYSAANAFLHAYCLGDPVLADAYEVVRVDLCLLDDVVPIVADVVAQAPDLVAFSTLHGNHALVRGVMATLRAMHPEMPLMVGGMDASSFPEFFLGPAGPADLVVCGEGEQTFGEVLLRLLEGPPTPDRLAGLAGVSYFDGERVVHGPERPAQAELDAFPSPILTGAIDLHHHPGMIQLETYRGCPFVCAFCYEGRGFSRIRNFSFDRVLQEVGAILEARVPLLRFYDTTFNYNVRRTGELLEFIARHNRGTECHAEMKLELLTPELIAMLPKAGFREVEFGMQTINRRTLQLHDRTWNQERFEANLALLREHGVQPIVHVMAGLPGDRLDDVMRSIDYVDERGANTILFHLRVVPGTPMAARPAQDGCVVVNDGTGRVVHNRSFDTPDFMRISSIVRAHELTRQCLFHTPLRRGLLSALGMTYSAFLDALAQWMDAEGLTRRERFCPDRLGPEQDDPEALVLFERFVQGLPGAADSTAVGVALSWARFEHTAKRVLDRGRRAPPTPAERLTLRAGTRPRPAVGSALVTLGYDIGPLLRGGALDEVEPGRWSVLLRVADGRLQTMELEEPMVRVLRACDGIETVGALMGEPERFGLEDPRQVRAVIRGLLELGVLEAPRAAVPEAAHVAQ
ncbi:MAG: B12-binding domain-containing radical SAM protein [Myxococcales bacterium]|nr:B12-binding domain-containing radical SAM protein [Myxococcales bacterium]